jgi:hypothetical protein
MKQALVTFNVVHNGGQSRTSVFMERVEMTNEQYDAFNLDQLGGGHSLSRWIGNNLTYKFAGLIDHSQPWSIVDPGIQSA